VKEIVTAIFFICVGIFFLFNGTAYHVGTASAMGPGFFPLVLSIAMISLGIAILIRGLRGRH
jgi:hypothetical protein